MLLDWISLSNLLEKAFPSSALTRMIIILCLLEKFINELDEEFDDAFVKSKVNGVEL